MSLTYKKEEMKILENISPVSVEKRVDDPDLVVYTFSIVPTKGPFANEKIIYANIFEGEFESSPEALLWEFSDDTVESFPEEQVEIIDEATALGKDINIWYTLFKAKVREYEYLDMLNLEDPEATMKVMRTVESIVTMFMEQNLHTVDALCFSANIKDRGRRTLYNRYVEMLKKQLGWKSLVAINKDDMHQFICYDENVLKEL